MYSSVIYNVSEDSLILYDLLVLEEFKGSGVEIERLEHFEKIVELEIPG